MCAYVSHKLSTELVMVSEAVGKPDAGFAYIVMQLTFCRVGQLKLVSFPD